MDTSKVKNYIIILLALVNLFLLSLILAEKQQEAEVRRTALRELQTLYEKSGVLLPAGLDISQTAPAGQGLTRDLAGERNMAESVLGRCTVAEQGGNIYVYSGPDGQGIFRGTGEFEMLLNFGAADTSRGKEQAARDIMKKMDIPCGSYVDTQVNGEQTIITLDGMFSGSEVYNARVSFRFSADSLMLVYGKRVFDTAVSTDRTQTIDAGTALVRFLSESTASGYVCTAVEGIASGYVMNVTVSGDCILDPVWHIETDTGDYTMNAETGRLETIAF
jgi:regulatory protein YycI of two-component signal transduction system YycFG